MSDYNDKGRALLFYLYFSMTEIILAEDKDEADWIFWNEVVELVEQSDVPLEKRAECFSDIMDYFTGREEGKYNYMGAGKYKEHMHYPDYIRTRQRYRFAEDNFLGSYWQSLIYENKAYRLKRAVQWLGVFCREIVPRADLIISYYSTCGHKEPFGYIYDVKMNKISIPQEKSTNPHSLKLERCLQELRKTAKSLTDMREKQFEEAYQSVLEHDIK